jgi:hypothetical protein
VRVRASRAYCPADSLPMHSLHVHHCCHLLELRPTAPEAHLEQLHPRRVHRHPDGLQ